MIAWWAPQDVAATLEPEVEGVVDLVDHLPADAVVVIVDTRVIRPAELAEARAGHDAVFVICCDASEVDEVLELAGDRDDVSLIGEPARLVMARALWALRRAVPDRDGLTGLLTRRAFAHAIEQVVAQSDEPAALVIFDIDHFKRVNDTHGHLAGDQVLREFGRRLRAAVGDNEPLARIGGEEFAAFIDGGDARATAELGLEKVRGEPIAGVEVTASAGVAVRPARSGEAIGELWRHADEALYAAKARGRDQVISYVDLQREAASSGRDVELDNFENRTRVLADKVADVIARRGRRLFEELKEQADVDALTGLFSRRYLDRRLELEVEAARSRTLPLSVALLDIDAFGEVNKQHGWPTGDRVLAEIAERIRDNVRADDWVARYGGEEICVVMLGTGLEQAAVVLERIRAAIEAAPFSTTGGVSLSITASLGAAELDGNGDGVAELLERASARLLRAKGAGKNQVCV